MFRLLQWSDSHLANAAVQATQTLISSIPDLDFCVHCGDITNAYNQQGIGDYDATKSVCVIGNHDSIDQSGTDPAGYHWDIQVSQNSLYNSYLAKSKTPFGIEIEAGTTWWSKEFKEKGVLVLGINDTVLGDAQAAQAQWFKNRLAYAEQNGLAIILVKHGPSNYVNVVENSFTTNYAAGDSFVTDKNDYNRTYSGNDKLIGELTKTTAKVLCVLYGHEHTDAYGCITKNDSSEIPAISVGSTLIDKFNDVARSTDTSLTSAVVTNLIEIDGNSLYVYRLGADGCSTGAARKMLTFSYSKNKVVSICSA